MKTMTDQEAREYMEQVADRLRAEGNRDSAAKLELVREYLTNPEFRQNLKEYVFNRTYRPGSGA